MSEELAAAFLARLREIQGERGLNDRQFAGVIGVSQPYWHRLRRGDRGRRLSLSFALRVVAAIPEMALFLTEDLHIVESGSTMWTPEGEEGTANDG